jgi:putative hydrolase of the HAD superfamily
MVARGSAIRALMIDVDGVLVHGRPSDGRPWAADLEADLGIDPSDLHRAFFAPHWGDIVVGKAGLEERLGPVLSKIAPSVTARYFMEYWFERDARLDVGLLDALARYRAQGIRICLATNQEHERAAFLMRRLGLETHVDAIFYSAALATSRASRTMRPSRAGMLRPSTSRLSR